MKPYLDKTQAVQIARDTAKLPHQDLWTLEQVYVLTGSKAAKRILDTKCPGWTASFEPFRS